MDKSRQSSRNETSHVTSFFKTDPRILGFIEEGEVSSTGPQAPTSVPILEFKRGNQGQTMLYSDKSI